MRRNLSFLFLGLILILIGVLWGGNSVGLWDFDIFFPGWWTLILIVMPIFGMIQHGVKSFDIVVLFVGILFLLSSLNILDWSMVWTLFFPALMILIGILVIISIFKRKTPEGINAEAMSNVFTIFSGNKQNYAGQKYEGGRVEAIFGGVDMDLRSAVIEEDIWMTVSATFGGVKIWFPPNVRVIPDDSSIFGSVQNKTVNNTALNIPEVHIRCSAVFGAVELF